MKLYILKRFLLIFPTLFGIMLINFIVVQFAPGGPVENILAKLESGSGNDATERFSGLGQEGRSFDNSGLYKGSSGVDQELIDQLNSDFGFDKPASERFIIMFWNYLRFDFGESYYRSEPVVDLIAEKLPVSISLGLWTVLISYIISIPLGIKKAVKDGTPFDIWTSALVVLGYAIPGFLFAIFLVFLFAGGSYLQIFPLRGLTSDGWDIMPWYLKITDYIWHIILPVISMSISSFATLTLLTKNSITEELGKQYVITAKMKGLDEKSVLYKHIFKNAILVIVASFPTAFVKIFLAGSIIIETIFSLDGLGLLGFEAVVNRDYPVVFGTLYIFSLLGLAINIAADIIYVYVDPRIDFSKRVS